MYQSVNSSPRGTSQVIPAANVPLGTVCSPCMGCYVCPQLFCKCGLMEMFPIKVNPATSNSKSKNNDRNASWKSSAAQFLNSLQNSCIKLSLGISTQALQIEVTAGWLYAACEALRFFTFTPSLCNGEVQLARCFNMKNWSIVRERERPVVTWKRHGWGSPFRLPLRFC